MRQAKIRHLWSIPVVFPSCTSFFWKIALALRASNRNINTNAHLKAHLRGHHSTLCAMSLLKQITRYATTLTPNAGLGLQRVECRTPARSTNPNSCSTGPALWEFFRKSAVVQGKGPGVQGKRWPNTDTAFLALRLGVVLHLPMKNGTLFRLSSCALQVLW